MSDAKFTINLDFKGRNDLEKIIEQIGKEHNIPVNVDISKAEIGVIQNLNKPFKEAYEGVRQFTSQLGLAISGVQQIYGALDRTIGSFVRAAQDAESADMALKGSFRATGMEVDINAQRMSQYASQLQKTTIYEDDVLKRQMAQMQNIGRFDNTDMLMGATKAAIGLSAAFGIDLATSMDLVGKAAAGNTSMLGRYGIVLNETASQAEKMNQVIALGDNYFGIAGDKARDSAGKLEQLKNAWGVANIIYVAMLVLLVCVKVIKMNHIVHGAHIKEQFQGAKVPRCQSSKVPRCQSVEVTSRPLDISTSRLRTFDFGLSTFNFGLSTLN